MAEHSGQTSTKLAELPAHVSAPDPAIYWSDNYVVLDFETTTELKGSPLAKGNRLVLAAYYTPHAGRVVHKFGSEYDMGELVAAIQDAAFIVCHNAKFELGWLKRCGLDLRNVVCFDTLIAEYVLGGNRFGLHQLSLNECLKRHDLPAKLDVVGMMIKGGVPVPDIPESWLLKYCIRDVEATGELFLRQRELLTKGGLAAVNYQRNLVTPCLTDIEFNGMQLDCEVIKERLDYEENRYIGLTNRLQAFCKGASPSSTKQMREFIFGDLNFSIPCDYKGNPFLTPAGDPSVAAAVVEKLVAKTKRQKDFVALRQEWASLHSDITKYLRKFADCCREDAGRLYGSFNQATTRTHRLSSNGLQHRVQFQNLNRGFKPFFRSRHDGWLLGEADGAQLEFRVAAHLGRDGVALRDIVSGRDIHKYTASVLNGIPMSEVVKGQRQDAKSDTFKPLYGGQSGTPAQQAYYAAFKERYKGIADCQTTWTQQVLRDKFLTTEWGLRYHWPDTKLTKSGYITNSTSIYNYPVQAFATAEIIPCALVCAWHRMREMESFMVNTVHDSIISELHPEEVGLWHDVAKQCLIKDSYDLIKALYGISLTVPLGAGVTVGTHWASKEASESEVTYEADPELYEQAAKEAGMT
jgi:DNA polymerase I-like protein with 3'-5' exonuclease and polymerase domains